MELDRQEKRLSSTYYDLNENSEKIYHLEGQHYVVEPIILMFNEDNYYLMVYSSHHDIIANCRVDRMEKVEIIDESITDKVLELRDSISGYTEQAFKNVWQKTGRCRAGIL